MSHNIKKLVMEAYDSTARAGGMRSPNPTEEERQLAPLIISAMSVSRNMFESKLEETLRTVEDMEELLIFSASLNEFLDQLMQRSDELRDKYHDLLHEGKLDDPKIQKRLSDMRRKSDLTFDLVVRIDKLRKAAKAAALQNREKTYHGT